ncbi:hydrolase [Sporolactobacillus inulinus]|uniref:Hydrolase n=1 Tax=Sporolactobacillus inulinus TaxID=2078 RepID=A0A4Y1Z8F6_9BACL|nr:HAD-IIB family hydrolase [Sporolactobacillus inulinus]GAY75313.1 hydrolase [Sporolactobacillus inulinus]
MAIHLIFSDIDGTLINSHHELTERTIRAVQGCTSRGIPFVLVSARMPSGISPLQRQLGLSCPIICYSGALIVDALLQSSARCTQRQ